MTALEFLQSLYPDGAPGRLPIVLKTEKGCYAEWFAGSDLTGAARYAEKKAADFNVYFGTCPQDYEAALAEKERRKGEPANPRYMRGFNSTTLGLPGFFFDCDVSGPGHTETALPATVQEALRFIESAMPLVPSIIVHTGGGLHLWWLFRELWTFDTEDERRKASLLLRYFQSTIRTRGRERGWKFDPTGDLARVLRLPGTWNRKEGLPPVQVRVSEHSEHRYGPDDFQRHLLNPEALREALARPRAERASGGDFPPAKLQPIREGCAWFAHCWEDAATLPEPDWRGALTIVARCKDGERLAHEMSKPYSRYAEEETTAKLAHARESIGPYTCGYIEEALSGADYCPSCPHRGEIKSPIVLGTALLQIYKAGKKLDVAASNGTHRGGAATQTATLVRAAAEDPELAACPDELILAAQTTGGDERAGYLRQLALTVASDPISADVWASRVAGQNLLTKTAFLLQTEQIRRERARKPSSPESEERAPALTAGDMLADAPVPTLRVPSGYVLTEEATLLMAEDAEGQPQARPIAFAPLLLTGRCRDAEEGTEALNIAWKRAGTGWREKLVDRGIALNSRRLPDLANDGLPVTDRTAGAVVDYFHKLEAINYAALPTRRTSSHLGWQGAAGRDGFLWGRNLIRADGEADGGVNAEELAADDWREDWTHFRGQASGDEQLADAFHAAGTFEGWREAIAPLQHYPKALVVFYAAFVPPLLELLQAPNFVVDVSNRTSTGKTTTLRVAASVWGGSDEKAPGAALGTWDSTRVYAERASAVLTGLPLILDDTKRSRDPRTVADLIYAAANGRGRGRGNPKGLARQRYWRTVLLSSGEAPATSFTQDGGTRQRLLSIRGLPFGSDSAKTGALVDRLNLGILTHYGHAGPRFVKWLLGNREKWPAFAAHYREMIGVLIEEAPNAGRLAQYGAAIHTAAWMAHRALGLPWPEPENAFGALWASIASEAEDAAGEVRALRDVVSWAYSRSESFYGRHQQDRDGNPKIPLGGWSGAWKKHAWQYLGVYPTVLERVLRDLKYEPAAILDGWKERGWLSLGEGGRLTKKVCVDGEKPRMIVLTKTAVDDVEGKDQGFEPDAEAG